MAAEGLSSHQRAGNRSIDIQVSDVKLLPRRFDVHRASRIDAAREGIGCIIGEMNGLLIRLCLHHRQYGPENFFLGQPVTRLDVAERDRSDKISRSIDLSFHEDATFPLADSYVPPDSFLRPLIDQRAHLRPGILRRADSKTHDRISKTPDEGIVHGSMQQSHGSRRNISGLNSR